MIDWEMKVRELKRIVNELEMLAQQLEGRQRMMLGRSADEIKQFARDIQYELRREHDEEMPHVALPDWLRTEVIPEGGAFEETDQSAEDDWQYEETYYEEQDDALS